MPRSSMDVCLHEIAPFATVPVNRLLFLQVRMFDQMWICEISTHGYDYPTRRSSQQLLI